MLHLSLQLTLGQVLYAVGEQETSIVRVEVAAGVIVNALQHKLILHLEQICAHPIITVGDAAKDTQLGLPLLGQHRVGALQRKAYTCSQPEGSTARHKERLVFHWLEEDSSAPQELSAYPILIN